ncbi:MAG: hypothetical protein WBO45_10730, partial [Planctomycetota bacterium]
MGHVHDTRATRRRSLAPGLTALAALAAATGGTAPAQRPPVRAVEAPIEFVTGQSDNLFSVLRSQDHIHEFEEGRREIDAGEHKAGVTRLVNLLRVENGGVVPVAPGRFLGLRFAVVTTLANLPPAATAAYAELAVAESGGQTEVMALATDQLLRLAERFPGSPLGQAARVRLGDLLLVAGDGLGAAGHFRTALD